MKIKVYSSTLNDTKSACDEILDKMTEISPNFVLIYCCCSFDAEIIQNSFKTAIPQIQLHITTSCQGSMTNHDSKEIPKIAVMAFESQNASTAFGTAVGSKSGDSSLSKVIASLLSQAVDTADRAGEIPSCIFFSSAPGNEEEILSHVSKFFHTSNIPLIGGSCADNSLEGHWWCANEQEVIKGDPISFTLIYKHQLEFFSLFSSGAQTTDHRGVITSSDKRVIHTIDNQPAAQVYNQWTNGLLDEELDSNSNTSSVVLGKTSLSPLAKILTSNKTTDYLLIHPESVAGTSLTVFADIKQGEDILLMSATKENLIQRPSAILNSLIKTHNLKRENILGCILVFCGGCQLTLGPDIQKVQEEFTKSCQNLPFISFFSFGEQSQINHEFAHGNLMISVNLIYRGF